ncbi:GntR family transcriptional regulator [Nioella aestuarii]|uniref:GntR family transcriptional regulator n=1 Tax=Nioella aestuarii TaxID=1662864 RepID=UPI003D7FF839
MPLAPLPQIQPAKTTDMVFDQLYESIISLALAPGAKISEAEVAGDLGVSRQPVRDAFFRLSKLGFLSIRPQRATLVTRISETAVLRAAFIRTALELACLRAALPRLTARDLEQLEKDITAQEAASAAGDKAGFHALDDRFHRRICEVAGHGYAWDLIREHKAHMDRVRFLSLSFGSVDALDDHRQLLRAMTRGDGREAEEIMHRHLNRIQAVTSRLRADHPAYFEEDTA